MRKAALLLFTVLIVLFISGCGSQSPVTPPAQNNSNLSQASVGLSVTDSPPAGVTVLFFQLSITGATLASSSGDVSLLPSNNPIPVDISQLQTDAAFLGNKDVAAGTYSSLSLAFANPQLTIYNGSGATVGGCANNTVCELQPSTTPLTLTFSTAPFPVTLTTTSPLAFKLDIHLDKVIQTDLTVNLAATNGVTISELTPPTSGAPVPLMGHLVGTVQSPTSTGFTLLTPDGRTFSISINSSTTYDYPSSVCSADNSTCLAAGQVVKVEVSLQPGGTLLATEVNYVQAASQTTVEGNIIRLSTSNGNTLMDLVLQQGPAAPSTLPFGHRVTVTVPPVGVTYAVNSGTFTIPNGLSFASAKDLLVGQQVSVVVQGSVTTASGSSGSSPWNGPAAITFTTNSIKLEPSQITGSVAAIYLSEASFTLSTLPNFFIPAAPNATSAPIPVPVNITIQTTGATKFTNFTTDSIMGLAVNDVVSVGGWVFSTPSNAPTVTVAAQQVLLRPGPTPLF